MGQRELNVEVRSKTGKGISRQLRQDGLLPGVVYGKGMDAVNVAVNAKELGSAIAGEGGHNALITLKGGSLDGNMVIVSEVQRDPLKGVLRHVDFHKISLTDKVRVEVPLSLVGTAAGVKEGGLLDFAMHTIALECLPTQIPEHIDVDVTNLTIGHSIHIGDLLLPAGIRVLEDSRASVVSILGKAREEAAPAAE